MRNDKPSTTARKVALNIISLGAKNGMEEVLPAGLTVAPGLRGRNISANPLRPSRSKGVPSTANPV